MDLSYSWLSKYFTVIGKCRNIDDGYTLPLAIITRANILLKYNEYRLAQEDLKNVLVINASFINK